MKHSWKAPRWAQRLSYKLLPSRRRITKLIDHLEAASIDTQQTHQHIRQLIDSRKPFLVGRPGGTESEGLHFFLKYRLHSRRTKMRPYPHTYKDLILRYSGVPSKSDHQLDLFHLEYLRATLASDVVGFGRFAPGALRVTYMLEIAGAKIAPISNLEPLLAHSRLLKPWTAALAGKRVLVIHPFAESIERQFANRESITGVSQIMPEFDLEVIRPPVTFAGEQSDKPWIAHFEKLVADTQEREFEIALIGAGSYGLPIAHEIAKSGKQAIHLGGSLQLLFGIRGKRWESMSPYCDYMDATWVRPSLSEIPRGSNSVEGGAYW